MPFRVFMQDPRLRPTEEASALVRVRLAQARKSLPARPMCVYPAEVAHTADKTNQSAARIDANSRSRYKYWLLQKRSLKPSVALLIRACTKMIQKKVSSS